MSAYSTGVRFAFLPTLSEGTILRQWIGCQRVVYNAKVAEDAYFNSVRRKALSLTGIKTPLDQQYSQFKSDLTPWLSQVPSQILRNGAVKWMGAKQRQLAGLAQAPVKHRAHGRQSVLVTSELFSIQPLPAGAPAEQRERVLLIGTPKFPVGAISFIAHRAFETPKQIVISVEAGKWFVSFSFEELSNEILRTPSELAYELNNLSDAELEKITVGYDRGVANRLTDSVETFYAVDPVVEERIQRKEVRTKRYQRKLARLVKGSANRNKTKQTIATLQNYRKRCAQDWAHKVTYKMVTSGAKVHVLEALQVRNMTRKAKAKQVDGKWVKNRRAAKSGLNKAILGSCWGRVSTYVQYKAARRNQLVLTVPAHHSSQECSECKHTHPENRPNQATFLCQRCGHAEHADINASRVIKQRGIAALRAGIVIKPKKSVTRKQKEKTGAGCPGVSVERSNKTLGKETSRVHIATKQKTSSGDARSPFL